MKRINLLNRFVSLLLCAAMVITYLPGSAFIFAEDGGDDSAAAAVENPKPSESESSSDNAEKEKKAPEAPAVQAAPAKTEPPKENASESVPVEDESLPAADEGGSDETRGPPEAETTEQVGSDEGSADASADAVVEAAPEASEAQTEEAAEEPAPAEEEEAKEEETWTVTFYNRDAIVHKTVEVEKGKAIGGKLPATIAREDYNAYWAIGEIITGGQGKEIKVTGARIDSGFTPTKDTVIVPDYDPISYTVSFYESEDAATPMATRKVSADSNYCVNDIPAVPGKDGFAGKWVYSGGNFDNTVASHADRKVWAEYDQTIFTVTFTVEGKEYQKDTYYSGDSLTLPSAPVVEGKDFEGWFAGEKQYKGGEKVNSDLTLAAKFDNQFSVTFVISNEDEEIERLSQYFRGDGEAIGTMPEDPFVAGKIFEKWVDEKGNTVTAETIVKGDMVVKAEFKTIDVYRITAEYYYLNDRGEEIIFNTDFIELEAEELPYTITAPSTTQTSGDQVAGSPIYYPETPSMEIKASDFDNENTKKVRFKYVAYTAEYDFVYMLKDLEGDGYTEIPDSRDPNVRGVLNSYVTPTVKNFDFATLELAEGATITQAKGQELRVKYTRKNFQLTYETNGGSYVEGTTAPYGTSIALPSSNPTKEGYTFEGWYSDPELTEKVTGSVTLNGNTTLYANWTGARVNYTIVYMFEKYNDAGTSSSYVYDNSRNGTGNVGSTVRASSAPAVTRTGWEVDTEKNATSSVVIAADGSSVLYVYYKLTEYTLNFDRNSRGWIIEPDGTTTTDTYSFKTKIGQDISGLWPSADSTTRYFTGWQKNGQGTRYITKQLIMNTGLLPTSGTSVTYYANWSDYANQRTVNYYLENADNDQYTRSETYSQTYYSDAGSLNPKEITGYTYDHSQNSGNTYNFYYKRDRFKIDYYYGSTRLNTINDVKFDANINKAPYVWTPTAAQCGVDSDYTFAGWYADSGLTSKYTFSTMPASNLVVYAKWDAPSFTVSFVDGDDTSSQLADSQTVEKYKKAEVPSNPSKAGFVFDGWYTTADGNTLFDWNTQITENTTVYAHWTRATLSYTVRYLDENDEPVAAEKVVSNPNFVIGQEVTEKAVAVTGYRPAANEMTLKLTGVNEDNVITFVYSEKATETKYVVHYIIDPEEISGNIKVAADKEETVSGDTASVVELAAAVDYAALYAAHPELEGIEFHPDHAEQSLVLTSDESKNVLTFKYSSFKNATVKVHYVDVTGKSIADDDVQHLKVGKTFTLSRTPIAGWELKNAVIGSGTTGSEAGNAYKITEAVCESGLEFTLVYQKKATITVIGASKQYDGTALTLAADLAGQVKVDGLLEGHSLSSVAYDYDNADSAGGKGRLNAGIATVTPKNAVIAGASSADYYAVRYISGTLEVTKINVTVRIEPDRWTGAPYTGEEYKAGFTNPVKTVEDYILISHPGYKAAYMDAIWDALKSKVDYDAGAAGLHYFGISEKNAGEHTYKVDFTASDLPDNDNYSVSLFGRDGLLQILTAPLTITTATDSKPYDGTALTNPEATLTGLVEADTDKVSAEATGTITDVGSTSNTYKINWGDVKSSNYDITENLGTLTVTKGQLKITVKDKTVPYNGQDQSGYTLPASITGTGAEISTDEYKIEGLAKGQVLTISGYTPSTGKAVGTYENGNIDGAAISVKDGDKDVTGSYDVEKTAGKLIITPVDEVVVTITGHSNTTDYDGEEHRVSGYDVSISNPLYTEADFEFTGTAAAARTNVGTTNMGLDADQFVNKSKNFKKVTFNVTDGFQTIEPIDVTVTIVGANNATNYDGEEHEVTGYTVNSGNPLYTEADFEFTGTAAAARTDVGTTNMGLAKEQFVNKNTNFGTVTFVVTDGYQTINPIEVTVTIVGANNTTDYDGKEHKVEGYTATADNVLYDVDKDFTFSGNAKAVRTDAGTTNMGLAADQFVNTNTNFSTVTFNVTDGFQTIRPIDGVKVTIVGKNNTTDYDGADHTVNGYTATSSNPLYTEADFTFSGEATATRKNVGTTGMGLSADQFENTNDNFTNVTFEITDGFQTIEPIDVTVTVVGNNNTAVYDAKDHTVEGYTATADNALYDVTKDFTFSGEATATRKLVGTTNMGLSADQFENTNTNFGTVTFEVTDGYQTITPVDEVVVTITGHNDTTDYDGAEHSVEGYDVSISNPLYTEADFEFTGTAEAARTNAGTTNMGLAERQFRNTNDNFDKVTFKVTDGFQTIEPIDVTVTIVGASNTTDYDGTVHSVSGYTATASTELYDVNNDIGFTGTANAQRVDVGTTNMNLADDQFENLNSNFKSVTFEITDGFQTINKKKLTITAESDKKVYDGAPLENNNVTDDYKAGLAATDKLDSITVTGSQTLVGESDNVPSGAKIVNVPGIDVTDNYDITYVNGTLKVTDGTNPDDPGPVPDDKVVQKTSESGAKYHIGDTVTWNIWVKNIYDEEKSLVVTEKEGVVLSSYPATLTPGQEITITATHVVTAGDVAATEYTNEVTVKLGDLEKHGDDTVKTETVKITITAASDKKVYDGEPLTNDGYELTSGALASGDKIDSVKVVGSQLLVGSSANVASGAVIASSTGEDVTKAYDITYVDGTLTVTDGTNPDDPGPVPDDKVVQKTSESGAKYHVGDTVTWNIWVKNIYDEEKSLVVTEKEGVVLSSYPATLTPGQEITITATHVVTADDVEAREYRNEVTAKLGDLEKHGDDTVETEPIKITITADSAKKVYDGTALTKKTASLTGGELASGDKIDSVKVVGSQLLVGSSANVASDAKIVNAAGEDVTKAYEISYADGTLTVTDGTNPDDPTPVPDDKVVKKSSNGATYRIGDTIEWTVWVKNIYEEEKTLTVTEAAGMNIVSTVPEKLAAGQEIEIKVQHVVTAADVAAGSVKNVVKVKLGDLEKEGDDTVVTKKLAITITAGSGRKVYDGTALRVNRFSMTAGTLASGDRIASVKVTGSRTAVGTSKNVPSNAKIVNAAGEDVTATYDITYINGLLRVTRAGGGGGNPTPGPTPGGNPGGPGITPAAPVDGDAAVVPEQPVPEAEPEVDIPDEGTPLAAGAWALINLICAAVTTLGAIVALFRKKEDEDEDEDEQNKPKTDDEEDEDDNRGKKMLAAKIAGAVAGVAGPVAFILTEDMSLPMQMIDKWTLLMVVILAAQIVAAIFNKKASELDDEEEEEAGAAAN